MPTWCELARHAWVLGLMLVNMLVNVTVIMLVNTGGFGHHHPRAAPWQSQEMEGHLAVHWQGMGSGLSDVMLLSCLRPHHPNTCPDTHHPNTYTCTHYSCRTPLKPIPLHSRVTWRC